MNAEVQTVLTTVAIFVSWLAWVLAFAALTVPYTRVVKNALIVLWLVITVLDLVAPWKPVLMPGQHVALDLVVIAVILLKPVTPKEEVRT